jgi:serine kinase of HPr protein (carbohydrate metabolism regulator)
VARKALAPDVLAGPHRDVAIRLHANAVLIGEGAVLVRGASGSGKTWLSLQLIEAARLAGLLSRLVGDDRIEISARHGRLVARPVAAIAGVVERRGLGLTPVVHEAAACLRLVVDLGDAPAPRLPEPADLVTEIAGVTLPRLLFQAGRADPSQVLVALALFGDEPWQR